MSINEHYHGLRAAEALLQLVEKMVNDGSLELQNIAIDFEDGSTRNFSPKEYVQLAIGGVEKSITEKKSTRNN